MDALGGTAGAYLGESVGFGGEGSLHLELLEEVLMELLEFLQVGLMPKEECRLENQIKGEFLL